MAMIMTMTSAGPNEIDPDDRYDHNSIDHGNNNGDGEQPQQQAAGHILVGLSVDDNVVNNNNQNNSGSHCAIHHCDGAAKMEEKRALAFAADACALCCLELTGTFILFLYLVQVGIWSWIFHKVYLTMPQTFSWEKLLRTFGSRYDDCVDRATEIELKPPSLCPNFFTAPAVPIIAILCLILNFFAGCSCLSKPRSKKMYTMVASCVTWQFIFTIIALVFVSIYFHTDIRGLEKSMMRELHKGIPVTSRWQLTQIINKCCGIRSFSDWKITTGQSSNDNITKTGQFKYPPSCFSYSSAGGGGGRAILQKNSCYDIEYANVKFYSIFEISLLCSGIITTMLFFCLATAIHGGARGHWSNRGGGPAGSGAAAVTTTMKDDAVGTADIVFLQGPSPHGHLHFHHGHHITLEEAESLGFSAENYQPALQTS